MQGLGSGNLTGVSRVWRKVRRVLRKPGVTWVVYILMEWLQLCCNPEPQELTLCRAGRSWLVSVSSSLRYKHLGRGSRSFWSCTHWSIISKHLYLHALSIFALGLEEGFGNSKPGPDGGRFTGFPWTWGLVGLWRGQLISNNTYSLRTSHALFSLRLKPPCCSHHSSQHEYEITILFFGGGGERTSCFWRCHFEPPHGISSSSSPGVWFPPSSGTSGLLPDLWQIILQNAVNRCMEVEPWSGMSVWCLLRSITEG